MRDNVQDTRKKSKRKEEIEGKGNNKAKKKKGDKKGTLSLRVYLYIQSIFASKSLSALSSYLRHRQ